MVISVLPIGDRTDSKWPEVIKSLSQHVFVQNNKKVVLKYCDDQNANQRWWWDGMDDATLKRQNANLQAIVEPPELDYLS